MKAIAPPPILEVMAIAHLLGKQEGGLCLPFLFRGISLAKTSSALSQRLQPLL
jgi:hypothetical protein